MESPREVEFVFEPQEEGGYHVYAPEMPGLHTEGDDLDEATENAREALALYVEGLPGWLHASGTDRKSRTVRRGVGR